MRNLNLAFGIVFGIALASTALADTTSDLIALTAQTRTVIGSNASIDSNNTEQVTFSTNIAGQLVELNLNGLRLNDSFLTSINYSMSPAAGKAKSTTPTDFVFGNVKITLDGCDVTSALLAQCTADSCWDSSITPVPTTTLTGKFSTKINLSLSQLVPTSISGCGIAQSSFFYTSSLTHTLTFAEQTAGAGGNLNYQVILYQTTAE